MNSAYPSVSVIVPVFNREQYVAEAINSILQQSCPPKEVIVVDDGSSDRSAEIVQSFGTPVHYYWQPNGGAATARNRGVGSAQGEYLAFLDSDDRWLPDKLAQQLAAFDTDPQLDMVFGHVRQFWSPELDQVSTVRLSAEVMPGYHVGTLLIRREAFWRVGLFETTWRVGEFVSWQARAMDLGLKLAMLPSVLMERRLHLSNMGRTERHASSDYLHIVKAALDRRRAQASLSESP